MNRRLIATLFVLALMMGLLALGGCAAQPAATAQPGAQASPDPVADPEAEEGESEAETGPEAEADPVADPGPEVTSEAGSGGQGALTLYSGRSEELVGPIIERFEESSGVDVEVRWGSTSELAALLLEEGANSRADVYFAQDPGGLGAVATMMTPLPDDVLDRVDARFRDPEGRWVGISGRARVVVYNTERVSETELPQDLSGFVDPSWKGRIGWAPTNASFQAMVTAMRVLWGEEETRAWLEGMLANEPVVYEGNSPIVAAVGAGEIDIGLVNHYYLYRFLAEEGEDFAARNYYMPGAGPGSLLMVAGAGVLASSDQQEAGEQLVAFLLSPEAQQYFADETFEYPLAEGIEASVELPALDELEAPEIELTELADLEGTLALLSEVGVLP